ncbi:MAG: hypothetical protein HRU19_05275 [Pseudobacteriovorax sp.]|nr:hypothetical protein [Pseudobacteriovorax sp.]
MSKPNNSRKLKSLLEFAGSIKDLKFRQVPWDGEMHEPLFEFRAVSQSASFNGIHIDKSIALTKAIARYVEDKTTSDLDLPPGYKGIACHFHKELAEKAASQELVKMDCLFSHYLTQTPWIDMTDQAKQDRLIAKIDMYANRHRFSLKIGLLRTLDPFVVVIAAVPDDKKQGVLVESSVHDNLSEAVRKAALASLSRIRAFSKQPIAPIHPDDIDWPVISDSEIHKKIAYHVSSRDKILPLFVEQSRVEGTNYEELGDFTFDYEVLHTPAPDEPGSNPLFVVKATCDQLVSHVPTCDNKSIVNLERFSKFAGEPIKDSDIELWPIPFF